MKYFMLIKKNVGIFIRGIRNADSEDVKQLELHQDILEKDLGLSIGESYKIREYFSIKNHTEI